MIPFQVKTRKKPDSCDAHRCRARGKLSKVTDGDQKMKLCDMHKNEWLTANAPPGAPVIPPGAPPLEDPLATIVDGVPEEAADAASISYSQSTVLAAVEPVKADAETTFAQLIGIQINSQGALDAANKLLQDVKGKMKALEAQRTSVTKPMLDAKKQIDAWFKPAKGALTKLETLLKEAIGGYLTAQETARLAALQAGDHEGALAIDQPTIPAGLATRTIWNFEVIDEAFIPREYIVIDAAKIQQHVNIYKAQSTIPGIVVRPDTGISSTSTPSE